MKTKVGLIKLKEMGETEHDQENEICLRIRTGDGELMINRAIQLFSQYPRERLEYDPLLNIEIVEDYMQKFCIGFSIITILHCDEINWELADAVYGPNDRKVEDAYATFVQWASRYVRESISDWLRCGLHSSVHDITLRLLTQLLRDASIDEGATHTLMKELLKARRRIKYFNLRYMEQAERFLALTDEEDWDK